MKYITLQLGESWGEWIKKVFPRGTQKEIPTKHTHQLGKNSKKKDDPGNIWQSDLASRHSSSTRKNSEVKNKALRLSAWLKWEALFFLFSSAEFGFRWMPTGNKVLYIFAPQWHQYIHCWNASVPTARVLGLTHLPAALGQQTHEITSTLVSMLSKGIFFAGRWNRRCSHSREHTSSVTPWAQDQELWRLIQMRSDFLVRAVIDSWCPL